MHLKSCLTVTMLFLYTAFVFAQDRALPAGLETLVQTEREFARSCVERGIRSSFLEYFADDAIVFQPHPVKYKEAVKDQPAPADPLAYTLDWEPLFSDISAAGDLGYNTGPYILTDNSPQRRPPQHGFFFSVWKQQFNGEWRVVLDVGTETNAAYTGSRELRTGSAAGSTAAVDPQQDQHASLFAAERALQESASKTGMAGAYAGVLNSDSRLHRNGMQPLLGQKPIVQYLRQRENYQPSWKPLFADIARSGDLGYVYGSYRFKRAGAEDSALEQGYFTRVWKRGQDNKWRLVVDITSPLAAE